VCDELNEYFANPAHPFTLAVQLHGTEYQRQVWHALTTIPLGKTQTYGDFAHSSRAAPRAIGNACRRNPIPIIFPCHRIVAKTHLGGFSGATTGVFMDTKRWLLRHESALK